MIYKNQGQVFDIEAKKINSDKTFDYYEAVIPKSEHQTEYYFKVQSGMATCYYNRRGVMDEPIEYYNFRISPDYKTPDWAKGAVIYQIFVDRFYNGDPTNDVEDREYYYIGQYSSKVKNWEKYPASTLGVHEFYGGDLQGVREKLDYLQF